MSMIITHNMTALRTFDIANAMSNSLSKSIEKVSTGLRIHRAADDAAGLAISERMRAQISGLSKAISNAEDGISMIQTIAGALGETHSMLHRMRELSVQAASETLTTQDRFYVQAEIEQMRDEITHIGNSTQFNTKKLLNGEASLLWSSDNPNTQAIVQGKVTADGNYKISITAKAGSAQVQKTNIMKLKRQVVEEQSGTGAVTLKGITEELAASFEKSSNILTITVDGKKLMVKGGDVKAQGGASAKDRLVAAISAANTASVTDEADTPPLDMTAASFTEDELTLTAADPNATVTAGIDTIGLLASHNTRLYDIDMFWNEDDTYLLNDPQIISITQGDGEAANLVLYGNDTVDDFVTKLNGAIAVDLGQGQYVNDGNKFATFVENAASGTSEGTAGTIVIRSIRPAQAGELNFKAGVGESLLYLMGINQIQAASETEYNINVTDAHTGTAIASNVKLSGNRMIGVIHKNIDVMFDSMSGITAKWNDRTKSFEYNTPVTEDTYLHIAANTTAFLIGANTGEDLAISVSDMRSQALGLDEVLVTDRDSAARSITIIDNAIDKVSAEMVELGKYGDRLEYTVQNLMGTYTNLGASEARIRDTDMAAEMMTLAKLRIGLQADMAMAAQANQISQSVLSLIE